MSTTTTAPAATPHPPQGEPIGLVFWEDHQKTNIHVFPTSESWRWFERQHRDELIAKGALCFVAGRKFVVPDRFRDALLSIGVRLAAARTA